jgi:hypothetical protein
MKLVVDMGDIVGPSVQEIKHRHCDFVGLLRNSDKILSLNALPFKSLNL